MHKSGSHSGRLFVANRGEIALRVINAAHALGMEAVVGVSSADRDGLVARSADRAVTLGPPAARSSYLNPSLVVHAAKATGCSALHPGYGFLSERAELAQLCEDEGIIFVGPTAEAIRQVGDKLSARALARAAAVPMTNGTERVCDLVAALEAAARLGYPVITKASAGGGGRGMVVAYRPADLAASFEQAATTAQEAFGDGALYLERYVEVARHVEVQIMGDGLGGVVHFGERDCSIQRRYQKMVEEAPAAILSSHVRQKLQAAAVTLLSSIRYRNAGTVEFLYDPDGQDFFFMEVNARIQVEHPVSEEVTGADLVQLQLRLSTGTCNHLDQAEITVRGHAIEARIVAEDPDRDFAPSPGRITRWSPAKGIGIRVDTAMETGALVSPYYDSMIAKLIVLGETREEAVERLTTALAQFEVEGVDTNLPLLRFIADHADFRANHVHTRWLETTLLPAFKARRKH